VFPEIFGDTVREALSAALPPDEHGWQEVTLQSELTVCSRGQSSGDLREHTGSGMRLLAT
jgi:hypothetical protein